MTIKKTHAAGGTTLQYASVHITHVRGGLVIADGVVDEYENGEHAAHRAKFNSPAARAGRLARRFLPFAMLGLVAYGARHGSLDSVMHALPAATVITNGGQAIVTNLFSGIGGTVPKFVMWGTGAGTAAVTDTTLFTETTDEARTSGTVSRVTTTVTNDTYQVVGTITVATSGKTVTNVGLFDVVTSVSGNLYFKSDFTGIALLVADSITFTIKVKFS